MSFRSVNLNIFERAPSDFSISTSQVKGLQACARQGWQKSLPKLGNWLMRLSDLAKVM